MFVLPIVERELRLKARRPSAYWLRFGVSLFAGIVSISLLAPSFRGISPPSETGRLIFLLLAAVAFPCCLFAGPFLTADCLSEEKRNGTMGLLFLTSLRGYDVVIGKLFATTLQVFFTVLAFIPFMALALLFGGVGVGELIRVLLVMVNSLFFSSTLGLMVSSVTKQARLAWTASTVLIALFLALPWAGVFFQSQGLVRSQHLAGTDPLLTLSPIYPAYLSFDAAYQAASLPFWNSLFVQHALGWLFLVTACLALPRTWTENPPHPRRARLARFWRICTLGTDAHQERSRKLWLDQNPILWLSRRHRHPQAFLWGFIGFIVPAAAFCLFHPRHAAVSAGLLFSLATLLHTVLKGWLMSEVTRRLSVHRSEGVLEVLLVTPMSDGEILRGLLAGIQRQFLLPIAAVLAVDVLLLAFGLGQSGLAILFVAQIGIFAADCYTITWFGAWKGLHEPTAAAALLRTALAILFFPWLIFLLLAGLSSVFWSSGSPPGWLVAVWFASAYGTNFILCARAMGGLTRRFRCAASEPMKSFRLKSFRLSPPSPAAAPL
jgi:ABC-type transport system involved in multi-copper enzyme maturation permease subunit